MSLMLAVTPQADWSFWQWVSFFITTRYPDFIRGAGVTLLISITGTLVGLAIGLLIGIIKTIPYRPGQPVFQRVILKIVRGILQVYIEVFRGTPMIVQAMVIYYGLAQVFKIYLPVIGAGILIVSINTGAYMAEIVRGGIQAIPKG